VKGNRVVLRRKTLAFNPTADVELVPMIWADTSEANRVGIPIVDRIVKDRIGDSRCATAAA
jgi:hypothetical protein